jgi:UDP-N-acetylglucosamine acyltransferase
LVERIEAVAREFAGDPLVEKIIAFIRAGGRRPLMRPRAKHSADERGGDAG